MTVKMLTVIYCDTCHQIIEPPNTEALPFYQVPAKDVPRCCLSEDHSPSAIFNFMLTVDGDDVQNICKACVDAVFAELVGTS
jgi:hypothetical protein